MEAQGALPLMNSSWGLTETAPACLIVHEPIGRSGVSGVPVPGLTVKLIPNDEMRCEIRVKEPNVMQGCLGDPAKTAEAFDDEGFFITGDAVRFVDEADPSRGLLFDGRVSEDFKLNTGTWVQAGGLRMNAGVSGSAKRIARAIVLAEPPSLEASEITDKGSLNPRKIITRRSALLERLYDNEDPALIRV